MLRQTSNEEQTLDCTAEMAASIAEEGLRYVSDSAPGYTRKRTGTIFGYYDKDGERITTPPSSSASSQSASLQPTNPCGPSANGHIQATGLDARARKQYRYHAKWRELRDENKYEHIIQFAAALPALRNRVATDMKLDALPREKVLATIVSLLEKTLDDDGQPHTVDSGDVNAYIKDVTGEDFSAKDFRTWAGTVLAALALTEFKKYDSQAEAKRNVVAAIESVSKQLGNTPAICRKCYVHPEVLNAYMSGDLVKMIEAKIAQKFKRRYAKLSSDEIMVLAFLRRRLGSLTA